MALGHPLGCTGVKLMTTLVHELHRSQSRHCQRHHRGACLGGAAEQALSLDARCPLTRLAPKVLDAAVLVLLGRCIYWSPAWRVCAFAESGDSPRTRPRSRVFRVVPLRATSCSSRQGSPTPRHDVFRTTARRVPRLSGLPYCLQANG